MMNENDRLRILDYVCGRLAEDERVRLESELEHNDELRQELQQHQKADDWLAALPDQRVRSDQELERFVHRVIQAARHEVAPVSGATAQASAAARVRRLRTPRAMWLAAAAVLLGVGLYAGYAVLQSREPGSTESTAPLLSEDRVLAILADPEVGASFEMIERLPLLTDEELAEALEVDDSDWFLLETLDALSGA